MLSEHKQKEKYNMAPCCRLLRLRAVAKLMDKPDRLSVQLYQGEKTQIMTSL